jgi:hypothetical protein
MAEEKGLASALIEAGVMLTQSPFTTTTPSELHRIAATIEAIAKEHDQVPLIRMSSSRRNAP